MLTEIEEEECASLTITQTNYDKAIISSALIRLNVKDNIIYKLNTEYSVFESRSESMENKIKPTDLKKSVQNQ